MLGADVSLNPNIDGVNFIKQRNVLKLVSILKKMWFNAGYLITMYIYYIYINNLNFKLNLFIINIILQISNAT